MLAAQEASAWIFPGCDLWVASFGPSSAVDSLLVFRLVSTRESGLCQVREGCCARLAEAMLKDKVPNPGLPFAGRQPPRSDPLHLLLLCPGFTNVLKILTKESSREELLSFLQHYGSHYIAEALYGSELTCVIHFPSKKVQQQLWLQYQKGRPGGLAGGGGQLGRGGQAAGGVTELLGAKSWPCHVETGRPQASPRASLGFMFTGDGVRGRVMIPQDSFSSGVF